MSTNNTRRRKAKKRPPFRDQLTERALVRAVEMPHKWQRDQGPIAIRPTKIWVPRGEGESDVEYGRRVGNIEVVMAHMAERLRKPL